MKANNKQHGFTLIELMIVIAIIGVLAAIALPIYQDYIAKSQITRVLYEVSSVRSAVEDIVGNGNTPSTNPDDRNGSRSDGQGGKYEYIGIDGDDPQSNLMKIAEVDFKTDPRTDLTITATFSKDAMKGIQGLKLTMQRTPSEWKCIVDTSGASVWKDKYLPAACSVKK